MSDDIFDQLVDEVLADEETLADEESLADEGSETDFALEDDESSSGGLQGSREVPKTADDVPLRPKTEDDPVENRSGGDSGVGDSTVAVAASTSAVGEDSTVARESSVSGASAIDKKKASKVASLPLSTATSFNHPDYVVTQTLSLVSAHRVVGLGALGDGEGRSKSGEKRLAGVEQELKHELRKLANSRGGHAVIGVDIALNVNGDQIVGHAVGTPVRLRKRDS